MLRRRERVVGINVAVGLARHGRSSRGRGQQPWEPQERAPFLLGSPLEVLYGRSEHMGWATGHITHLRVGSTVLFRSPGNSMSPRIGLRPLYAIEPQLRAILELHSGDIVLGKLRGTEHEDFIDSI